METKDGADMEGSSRSFGVSLGLKTDACGVELIEVEVVRYLQGCLLEFLVDGVLFIEIKLAWMGD
jgi:hypothetical protein